jgi:hypothetical protein
VPLIPAKKHLEFKVDHYPVEVAFCGTFPLLTGGRERTSRAILNSVNSLAKQGVQTNGQENVNLFCKPQPPHTRQTPKLIP